MMHDTEDTHSFILSRVGHILNESSRNNLVGQSSSDLLSDRGIYRGNGENIFGYLS